jgi:hypothetical protein
VRLSRTLYTNNPLGHPKITLPFHRTPNLVLSFEAASQLPLSGQSKSFSPDPTNISAAHAFTNLPTLCKNKFSSSSPSLPHTLLSLHALPLPFPSTASSFTHTSEGRSILHPSNAIAHTGAQNRCHHATSSLLLNTCSYRRNCPPGFKISRTRLDTRLLWCGDAAECKNGYHGIDELRLP